MNGLTRQDFTVLPSTIVAVNTFESDIRTLWGAQEKARLNLLEAVSKKKPASAIEQERLRFVYEATHRVYVRNLLEKAGISLDWLESAVVKSDALGNCAEIRYFDTNPESVNHGHVTVFSNGRVVRHRTPLVLRKHLRLVK